MQRPCGFSCVRVGWSLLLAGTLWNPAPARAQLILTGSGPNGTVNIFNTDLAVFESGENRKDLACTVTPSKPVLGFDLRFHTGYEVTIPLKELAGSENMLTILFRVELQSRRDQPTYFAQHIRVPAIEDDAKGEAYLQGAFDLGEGQYHVDWLMRDRAERVCSYSWDSEAALAPKDRPMTLAIAPASILRADGEQFKEEPPVQRATNEPLLNVKFLVNFAPQNSLSAALQPLDTTALVSILRSIVRDPRIGKFSLVAFNMQEQKVVYRQEDVDRLDFPALGEALNSLNLGTVDLKRLGEKHGDTDFLADLVRREVVPNRQDHPDAVIFAGPKIMLDSNVSQDALKEAGEVDFPVFYMNYNLNPQAVPWKDAISRTVRFFRGYEYTITRPRDLFVAVSEMISRIVKSRNGRQAASISSQ
ncbi:MAG TPA: acetyltransferase [Bryobacteraceae bacterium]|nr:acetyltransferase [Bryobacteraceae bacterium]